MSERPTNQEPYYTVTLPLLRAIPVNSRNARFDILRSFALPVGWEATRGFESGHKFTALSEQNRLFAKLFAPRNGQYAQAIWITLQELGQLSLSIPILSPVGFCQETGVSGLIFPLGRVIGTDRFGKIYPEKDWQKINEVVRTNGLEPLSPNPTVGEKIVIVEVEGKQYAVDPIEDSEYSILHYLDPTF